MQSILAFAVAEELVEYNAGAAVRKPRYERQREHHIFLPAKVEEVRRKLADLRDRTLVSVLAYSGPRPEEVVLRLTWGDVGERTIRYVDTKRRRTRYTPRLAPLADDLREWYLASGRPEPTRPVFPAHDGAFGTATIGATGEPACGKTSLNARATTARTPSRGGRVADRLAPARATCGRASSRCAFTKGSR